jgi:phosphoglycerate dehydrogenase-like enzyme
LKSLIVVHPNFEASWPCSADHFFELWKEQGDVEFIRLDHSDNRNLGDIISNPAEFVRLVCWGVTATVDCLKKFTNLEEATFDPWPSQEGRDYLKNAGVTIYGQPTEGFWGQTVSEFGLALTLCGLRRIPQLHHEILTSLKPWDYSPPEGIGRPNTRGHQFCDNPNFTNGTIEGKRVRVVGAGNIGSRYASFCSMLGADVAIWDPFANEPSFHRAGARKEWHLDDLVKDAEIFTPMVPLTEKTNGIVTAEHIYALPKGCLVVLATRANICDMKAVRERVMADEIALSADVWDVEPLPLNDPLLGRHNVVHTPHEAGRTADANKKFAEKLAEQFKTR